MDWKIPLFEMNMGDEELNSVCEVIRSGWITMGERTQEFENQFAEFVGAQHAIFLANGTVALHLALAGLGIKPGDEVVCPSLTFVATANAARYLGAKPVFADVASLVDWNVNTESIRRVVGKHTKAIIVVHYAGYPCDMTSIMDFASRKGIPVIEDCAHAPGATHSGQHVGTWGTAGCFSFFSNKNMTTGEGGMLVTNDDRLAKKARLMRSHCMTTVSLDRHKGHAYSYDIVGLGYNFRPNEIGAALGLSQLQKLNSGNKDRMHKVHYYRQKLISNKRITIPFEEHSGESSWHIFPILLPHSISRNLVMEKMKKSGIQTSVHYPPLHLFSTFSDGSLQPQLPLTEDIGTRVLTLPLFPKLEKSQIDLVVDSLESAINSQDS